MPHFVPSFLLSSLSTQSHLTPTPQPPRWVLGPRILKFRDNLLLAELTAARTRCEPDAVPSPGPGTGPVFAHLQVEEVLQEGGAGSEGRMAAEGKRGGSWHAQRWRRCHWPRRLVLGGQLPSGWRMDTETPRRALWPPSPWQGSSLALVLSVSMVAMCSGCQLHVRQEMRRALLGRVNR